MCNTLPSLPPLSAHTHTHTHAQYSDGKIIATGQCNHRFHLDCIKQWCRKGQNLCPICGSPWTLGKEHAVVM